MSKTGQLAIKNGKDYLIKEENISNIFRLKKNIVLEIGFMEPWEPPLDLLLIVASS